MAIKFSQFNLRTDHTSGMYLVGYDGNQNIHITVDNLFDDFINGTENTIAMFVYLCNARRHCSLLLSL